MTTEDLRCGVAPATALALSMSRSQKHALFERNAALSSMISHSCMHQDRQRNHGRLVKCCCCVFQGRRRSAPCAHAPGFSARARSPGSSRPTSGGHDASTCRDSRINAIDRHLSFQFTLIKALDCPFTAAVVVRAALHHAQPRQFDMGVLLSARDGRNFRW